MNGFMLILKNIIPVGGLISLDAGVEIYLIIVEILLIGLGVFYFTFLTQTRNFF